MKNLRELFSYWDLCPVCKSKEKELSIYYSKYPKGKIKFSIGKQKLIILFEDDIDEYGITIDLDSNNVVFAASSFGPLAGGDYIFSVSCGICFRIKCEAYSYYESGKIKEPRFINEVINIDYNDENFLFETNSLHGESTLRISNINSTTAYTTVKLPLIKLSSLPLDDIEKLLTKFKNFLLLS